MRRMARDRSIRLRSDGSVPEPDRHVPPPPRTPNSGQGHRARINPRSGDTKEAARQPPLVFVGIAVSNVRLDVAVRPSSAPLRVAYDATGITRVLTQLSQWPPTLIVVAATGDLDPLLLRALVDAALPVIVVESAPGPGLCQGDGATGQDGHARCAGVGPLCAGIQPTLRGIPDAPTQELAALLARRRHVWAMQGAEPHRLDRAPDRVRTRIAAHLHGWHDELARLDADLDDLIQQSPVWRRVWYRTRNCQDSCSGPHGSVCPSRNEP
jgi:hypothetical protein